MVFKVSLLVKQVLHNKSYTKYKTIIRAHIILQSALKGDYADIFFVKTDGYKYNDAVIARTELAFVKFIMKNFGPGKFSIVKCAGGRKGTVSFWTGNIEKTRYIRFKGSLAPYLFSTTPVKRWHTIQQHISEIQ